MEMPLIRALSDTHVMREVAGLLPVVVALAIANPFLEGHS